MRLTTADPISPQAVVRRECRVLFFCSVVPLVSCSMGDAGSLAETRSTPPSEARDSLNRAVFVEGGAFIAGSDDWADEFPIGSPFSKSDEDVHRWTVQGFWMQEHEVTNAEYRRFRPTHDFAEGRERHPVVDVTWRQAMAYAVSIGGELPTEVEWEFAARGVERREYPWGDATPTCEKAHYAECTPRGTIEVMSRAPDATPEGVHDLAGNAREWVVPVWFVRQKHPVNHDAIKLKGGSFLHPAFFLRAASVTNDLDADYARRNIGFRVVWRPPDGTG